MVACYLVQVNELVKIM